MIRFPDVTPGEPVVVSATLFTTYLKCPQQGLGRLYGAYPSESVASFRGGLAHRLFARHLAEGPIAPGAVDQAAREEIGRSLNPKISALGLKPSDLSGVIREAGELYDRFRKVPTEGFRSAEVYLEQEPVPDVTLRGSVDAVYDEKGGGVRLVDWKTGALAGADNQLSFYALLWALVNGQLPSSVEALSVATGERYEAVPTTESTGATAQHVAALVSSLRTALATQRELERRGGGWCRYCPLLPECEEGRSAVAVFSR